MVEDSPVAYNTYNIGTIAPAVPGTASVTSIAAAGLKRSTSTITTTKKVHVGHDFPVNVTLTAEYEEDDIPLQFYLLNVDDVEEVESGTASAADMRTYYCEQTTQTTIAKLLKGENTYGCVLNIPADSSIDPLTGHTKTGVYYIVADANKYDSAEPDAYEIYQRSKDKLDENNTVMITTEYLSKPDLSIDSMDFTGGSDAPKDVMVFYDIDLSTLPGVNTGRDNAIPPILVRPVQSSRYFTGTVNVRSSSCDALNVPITFSLKGKSAVDGSDFNIPLMIYDEELKAYQTTYYIPILRANTSCMLSLGLMIPPDATDKNYFSAAVGGVNMANVASFTTADIAKYPLSWLRYNLGFGDDSYTYHDFSIVAEVNSAYDTNGNLGEGLVTESRFIKPNTDDKAYDPASYVAAGDSKTLSSENNSVSETFSIKLEKMNVDANQGIQNYPYCKLEGTEKVEEMKTVVIFWDGYAFSVGDTKFGGSAEIHEGMFFYNYSLYSMGCNVTGYLFNNPLVLVNTYLNAESHPYNSLSSNFVLNVEAGKRTFMADSGTGFQSRVWEHPIVLATGEKTMEKMLYFIKLTLIAGYDVCFTPGVSLDVNQDGSLKVSKYAGVLGSVHADASVSLAGLAGVGLYTWLDVLAIDLKQDTYTEVEHGTGLNENMVRGTLYRNCGLYLTGPKGYVNGYVQIKILFFKKRWEKQLFSFTSFRIPIFELDFAGSGTQNYWQQVEDASLLPKSSTAW
jgi:hypothetical protein